ncbi:hypothetical protein [Streptomyces sp. NPDC055186]
MSTTSGSRVPGAALVTVAALLQSIANGLLSGDLTGQESLLLSFLAFTTSALVFLQVTSARGSRREGARRSLRAAFRPLALMNAATAVAFLGFYWSLSLIPAPLAVAVDIGVGPLALALLRRQELSPAQRIGRLTLGVAALVLAVAAAVRMTTDGQSASGGTMLLGLGVAATAGLAGATIPLLSVRLGALGVTAAQVTAHRFHLTYVTALALLVVTGLPTSTLTDGSRMAFLAVIAVLGTALPLFVLQVGMLRTPPFVVALIVSSGPGLTYTVAALTGGQSFDALTFLLISGTLLLAFIGPSLMRLLEHRHPDEVLSRTRAPSESSLS